MQPGVNFVINLVLYRVCHGFRLTTRIAYFWVNFDPFWSEHHFWCSWGSIENWLESKIEPPSGNLAYPNHWNALHVRSRILELLEPSFKFNISMRLAVVVVAVLQSITNSWDGVSPSRTPKFLIIKYIRIGDVFVVVVVEVTFAIVTSLKNVQIMHSVVFVLMHF